MLAPFGLRPAPSGGHREILALRAVPCGTRLSLDRLDADRVHLPLPFASLQRRLRLLGAPARSAGNCLFSGLDAPPVSALLQPKNAVARVSLGGGLRPHSPAGRWGGLCRLGPAAVNGSPVLQSRTLAALGPGCRIRPWSGRIAVLRQRLKSSDVRRDGRACCPR